MLVGCVGLVGCRGGDTGPTSGVGHTANTGPKFENLTPIETVTTLQTQLTKGNAGAFWNALPASYQKNITDLVHTFGEKADSQVYDQSFDVLKNLVRVVKKQQGLIEKLPQLEMLAENDGKKKQAAQTALDILQTIADSDISSTSKLKTLDVGAFFRGPISTILKLSSAQVEGSAISPIDRLKKTKVTAKSQDDNNAVVEITMPAPFGDTEETQLTHLTHVEGKWVPSALAAEWGAQFPTIKEQMVQQLAKLDDPESRKQYLDFLKQVNDGLDEMGKATTPDELMAAATKMQTNIASSAMGAIGK